MKQKLITEYFSIVSNNSDNSENIVYGYNPKTDSWHCTLCGIDMDKNNPRKLCRKTYCENSYG